MDAKEIIGRLGGLKALRSNYEQGWSDIARLLRPTGKGFSSSTTEGQRKHTGIYDSSPLVALEHFKAGMFSSMTPPGSMWFELQHVDEGLNQYEPVKAYLDVVNERTWKSFGPGVSAFYNQVTSVYGDLGAFGTGVIYTTDVPGQPRMLDRARALHECWIDTNDYDEVDTLFRRYEMTAKAIVQRGDRPDEDERWSVPAKIRTEAEKTPEAKHWIIHAVYPDRAKAGDRYGKPFRECYVLEDGEHLLGEAGYYEFPYMVPRWDVAAGERYGTGPGHVILSDIKSLNIARRSNLNMMDRAARPTILTSKENDIGGGIAPYPGEIVYGGLSSEGKKLVAPMDEGKNPAVAIEQEERIRAGIKDGLYFGLMQIVGSTNMTATEFLGRDDERQRLLGPYLGRIESELLSPIVKRRVAMLERADQLPQMPKELAEYAGGLEIRYVSPLARLQRQRDAEAANRTVAAFLSAAQIRPDVADRLDPDMLAELIADGFGAKVLNSRQVAQDIRDNREQQLQIAAAAQMAPGAAKAVKDMTDAGATARSAPQAANAA